MTYSDAKQWRDEHLHLIGTIDKKGFVVSDLVIVPANDQDREVYLRTYLYSKNKDNAIIPYMNRDVQVWSVDLERLETHNILFYNVLAE